MGELQRERGEQGQVHEPQQDLAQVEAHEQPAQPVGVSGAITALGDTLFPASSLSEGVAADFSSSAHFLVRLRVYHPLSAIAVSALVTLTGVIVGARVPGARRLALALVVLFLLQIGGGLVNLFLLAPTWMQMIHLLLADAVWIALVLLGLKTLKAPPAATPHLEP